jgi:hypothetical protein
VPDELAFEESWPLTPVGFLWLAKPFEVPMPKLDYELKARFDASGLHALRLAAVGWIAIDGGGFQIVCYLNQGRRFGCWAYFTLREGEKVLDRLKQFEEKAPRGNPLKEDYAPYPKGRETELLHEVRWVYTALHLMAQRLTHTHQEPVSGMARESARRKKLTIPSILRVVTLRRMAEDRPQGLPRDVEWHWQWTVNGHWRKQPCGPGRAETRQVFIEAYVKGPADKPLKPPQHTLYVAAR